MKENIKKDIYKVIQMIQDPDELKIGIIDMYRRYVKKRRTQRIMDKDIYREYQNQLEYLKKSVDMLKRNL